MDSLYERMSGRTVDGVELWQKFRVDQTDERFDKIDAAPPAGRFFGKFAAGLLGRGRAFVRPRGGRGIEHVHDSHDLSEKRNRVSAQAVWIACAVAQLVMVSDDRANAFQRAQFAA